VFWAAQQRARHRLARRMTDACPCGCWNHGFTTLCKCFGCTHRMDSSLGSSNDLTDGIQLTSPGNVCFFGSCMSPTAHRTLARDHGQDEPACLGCEENQRRKLYQPVHSFALLFDFLLCHSEHGGSDGKGRETHNILAYGSASCRGQVSVGMFCFNISLRIFTARIQACPLQHAGGFFTVTACLALVSSLGPC